MRIISGIYKGRNILGFDINGTRPTTARVKESLFAMIQDFIKDSVILDLFSGSGNLGIEALSNGASYAYLVDYNIKACNVIKQNVKSLNIDNVKVICSDYKKTLCKLDSKVDIVFLDPPYKTDFIEKAIELITKYDVLNDKGIIVCESDNVDLIKYSDIYTLIKQKKYGDKHIFILQKNNIL